MQKQSNSLLFSDEAWALPADLYSCWNAKGLYNPIQFVLRLRPDIHRALNSAPVGFLTRDSLSEEQISAFSTYLHENIHWWQHVGSTTGFILSLIYPAQSHINHRHLKRILDEIGPVKSIRDYNLNFARPPEEESEVGREINIALNNWHDIEFYRWLVIDPINFKNNDRADDPYFECVGHAYDIAIGSVIWLLSATVDPDLNIFPDPRTWEAKMKVLRDREVEGFYYRSPITLPPIGAREIFEGQARFSQLQYLSAGRITSWDEFERAGMLSGVYVDAFNLFLETTGLGRPKYFDESSVGLFLLVCDIAINPSEGLIEDIPDFAELILLHDPGLRFLQLCDAISQNRDQFVSCIKDYSSKEYWAISDHLCSLAGFTSPFQLMQRVRSWEAQHKSIRDLLREDETFEFSLGNLPVRVFLARFIRLQIDKADTPEFFCWPGVLMTGAKKHAITSGAVMDLFEEHRAIFLDKEDGDVYPRTFNNRDERIVHNTFNTFYSWVVIYEFTRQWLVGKGSFDYNFAWLTTKYSQSVMEEWASSKFEEAFGISPSIFQIM